MKFSKTLFLFLLISSCSTTNVTYDYDREVDFDSYNSFAFYPEMNTGLSPLDRDRILESIETMLDKKGIPTSQHPDFFVNVFTEEYREPNRNRIGIGVGGTGRNVGVGVSGGIPLGDPDNRLKIIIDFIDVKNDFLFWQAIIHTKFNQEVSPAQQRAQFDKIVAKAFEEYPPE